MIIAVRLTIGSSPLARGKATAIWRFRAASRIIPACAGKSQRPQAKAGYQKDHPRLRGEKVDTSQAFFLRRGSSPLARGKVTQRSCQSYVPMDHPRLRGEKPIPLSISGDSEGSSPLARGKESMTGRYSICSRIIPACAGKRLKGSRYYPLFT